jgi:hypothetical protein
MIYLFPLMTIFWGGLFPSGLILYWIVYTAFLVVQQYTIMGWGNLFPVFGWQPRWVPRNEDGAPPRTVKTSAPANPGDGQPDVRQPATNPNRPATVGASGSSRQRPRQGQRRRRGRRR